MPRPSGIVHTPARASESGAAPVTSRPAIETAPAVGRIWPAMTPSVVLLPAPFGPSSPTTVPRGTTRSIPCSTWMRP